MAKETKDRFLMPSRFLTASSRVVQRSAGSSREPTAQKPEQKTQLLSDEELRTRLERNRRISEGFVERARKIAAKFSILRFGSTEYGYSKDSQSVLDDIDMALVLQPNLSAEEFFEQAKQVFGPNLSVQIPYLKGLVERKWDICHMYGEIEGVKLEFWIMRTDTFRYHASEPGSKKPVRDVANPDFKILMEQNWSIKDWKSIKTPLAHREVEFEDGSRHFIIENYFLSPDGSIMGGLGSRMLESASLYDPSETSQHDQKVLWTYWYRYVDACLKAHPKLTNDQIIDSLPRSERFSAEYRSRLSGIIDEVRYSRLHAGSTGA